MTTRLRRKKGQTSLPIMLSSADASLRKTTKQSSLFTCPPPIKYCLIVTSLFLLSYPLYLRAIMPSKSNFLHPKNQHIPQIQRSLKHSPPFTTKHHIDLPPASDPTLYDAIIVGCGPAGLTAALFASQMGMSTLVLGSLSGGSLAQTDTLDNFPSYVHTPRGGGKEWLQTTMDQAREFGARFAPPMVMATGLKRTGDVWTVSVDGQDHVAAGAIRDVRARTVIVASGSLPRKLDLPHESELWGRSLHNCALCDGDAYGSRSSRGDWSSNTNENNHGTASTINEKSVAVIGGGDAAVEAVSLLARIGVQSIHWIHRREEFKANAAEVERVRNLHNVQMWTSFVVVEWMVRPAATRHDGETVKILNGVRIVGSKNGVADPDATSSFTIPCDGAFLMIGSTPNTKWLESSGMEMDDVGLIRLMSRDAGSLDGAPFLPSQTSLAGVFAAGEAVDGMYRQALTAASDGAKSAMDAERYLRFHNAATITPMARERAEESRETPTDDYDDRGHDDVTHIGIDCDLSQSRCISQVVSEHPVVVFGKSFCSHCHRALEALEAEGAKPLNLQIDYMKNGRDVQDTLFDMTGRRTVPNVFVGGKTIGGGQETVELHESGELRKLLQAAHAISLVRFHPIGVDGESVQFS